MKNSISEIKNKIISSYINDEKTYDEAKSSNINVLLNRVKLDQKRESRKKILFSTAASAGVLLFGFLIF
jgi:hypothetical protein|tara:strand:+ start:370 stop:576 length:207 start_codon:yes stop_codon:yes gene_type:complete